MSIFSLDLEMLLIIQRDIRLLIIVLTKSITLLIKIYSSKIKIRQTFLLNRFMIMLFSSSIDELFWISIYR